MEIGKYQGVSKTEAFNLIIAGGRDFQDYDLLKQKVGEWLAGKTAAFEIVIVSDPCAGAGMLGERYAAEMGYEVAEFADDEDAGKIHVFTKNKQLTDFADACICFWDGRSNNCRHLIATANKVNVVSY